MPNTLYHNPRCSKSRQALALLEENGIKFEVKEYLKEGLSQKEIKELKNLLKADVKDFTRTKEGVFKELALKDASEAQIIKAMADNPILLERPIFVKGKKAIVGRPPENVLNL